MSFRTVVLMVGDPMGWVWNGSKSSHSQGSSLFNFIGGLRGTGENLD